MLFNAQDFHVQIFIQRSEEQDESRIDVDVDYGRSPASAAEIGREGSSIKGE